MIQNPPCETKKLCHTALLPSVQLVLLLEHCSSSALGCHAWETNCNTLLIAMAPIAFNQALKTAKTNLIKKIRIISQAFLVIMQAFAKKIKFLYTVEFVTPVYSHAIRKILMVCITWGCKLKHLSFIFLVLHEQTGDDL